MIKLLILLIVQNGPAGEESRYPNLARSGDTTYMTWWEGKALKISTRNDGRWTRAGTIVEGRDFFINWADFPTVAALSDGAVIVNWLEKSGRATFAYDVVIARSTDAGKTWSKGVRPHHDGTKTEHGFVSLVDRGGGRFAAIWLDGRQFASGRKEMTLRSGLFRDGKFGEEVLLDGRICDCCQTSAAATKSGIFVAYRDRSREEIRDISFVRFENDKWTIPKTLHEDDWKFPGCPVNGPAVAAKGDDLVVVWPTFPDNEGRVLALFSRDGGKTFGRPVRIDEGNPLGRVHVVWRESDALVSWVESGTGENAELRVRPVTIDGKVRDSSVIARVTNSRAAGFPRMVREGSSVLIAWTHPGKPTHIRLADFPD